MLRPAFDFAARPGSSRGVARRPWIATAIACGLVTTIARADPPYSVIAAPLPSQGAEFHAPVVRGPDGLVYAMAWMGGAYNHGAALRIEADGSLTVLHAFGADAADGADVPNGLVVAPDGWLYGVTQNGGVDGLGTIFRLSTAGAYEIVHTFSAHEFNGLGHPGTSLVVDAAGNLYGGLMDGGHSHGAVFEVTPDRRISILHRFGDNGDGEIPTGLVVAPNGWLYGITYLTHGTYGGTVFSIRPGGPLHTMHTFQCEVDGCQPAGTLVAGPDNAIYGTAPLYGLGGYHGGTVWRITYHGDFSVIHYFRPDDPLGNIPQGGLAQDADGQLYGDTEFGGSGDGGVLFSMTRNGKGKVLHAFASGSQTDGFFPVPSPTLFPDGALYGGTLLGGPPAAGVIYRFDLAP
jgi:uncharacterized repeat protein (TIGR03803 family)